MLCPLRSWGIVMHLFSRRDCRSLSGHLLPYTIGTDALSHASWTCIAEIACEQMPPFGRVIKTSPNSEGLVRAFTGLRTLRCKQVLLVDDQWVTGKTMRAAAMAYVRQNPSCYDWIGFVAFSRGPMPVNVWAFAQLM